MTRGQAMSGSRSFLLATNPATEPIAAKTHKSSRSGPVCMNRLWHGFGGIEVQRGWEWELGLFRQGEGRRSPICGKLRLAAGWSLLGRLCRKSNTQIGQVHARLQQAQCTSSVV